MMVNSDCNITIHLARIVVGYTSPYPSKHPVIIEKYRRLKYCSKNDF